MSICPKIYSLLISSTQKHDITQNTHLAFASPHFKTSLCSHRASFFVWIFFFSFYIFGIFATQSMIFLLFFLTSQKVTRTEYKINPISSMVSRGLTRESMFHCCWESHKRGNVSSTHSRIKQRKQKKALQHSLSCL